MKSLRCCRCNVLHEVGEDDPATRLPKGWDWLPRTNRDGPGLEVSVEAMDEKPGLERVLDHLELSLGEPVHREGCCPDCVARDVVDEEWPTKDMQRAHRWWMSYMLPNERGEKFKGRVGRRARKRGPPSGWLADGRPDPGADPWVIRGLTRKQWEAIGSPAGR